MLRFLHLKMLFYCTASSQQQVIITVLITLSCVYLIERRCCRQPLMTFLKLKKILPEEHCWISKISTLLIYVPTATFRANWIFFLWSVKSLPSSSFVPTCTTMFEQLHNIYIIYLIWSYTKCVQYIHRMARTIGALCNMLRQLTHPVNHANVVSVLRSLQKAQSSRW